MRKIILIIGIIITVVIILSIALLRSDSGFKSVYFVPEDAFVIIETPDPIKAWKSIVASNIWDYYKSNPYFSELNSDIQSYDSLVRSNKLLWRLMGEKAITISFHPFGKNTYEALYIADIGKIAKSKNPEKLVKTVLGKNYQVTSRIHHEVKIIEIFDKEEKENYFVCMASGKAVFSFEPLLIEKSIEASQKKVIGRNMKFLDVKSEISQNGLFQVYINYKQISNFIEPLVIDATNSFKHNVRYMMYTGLTFDIIENDMISIDGYTSLNDTTPDDYLSMLYKGENTIAAGNVIPKRLASMFKVNFKDAGSFLANTMKSASNESYLEYQKSIKFIEKRLEIDVDKNLFDWMDKELVLLQTQPSNLGRNNEFAMVLHAKDSLEAADNLNFIWKQIKRNSPVKIKRIKYKNYKIDYVAFPGIIQAFFGKALENIEKPYFTQIGNNVICSNHPQTLKNLIDDFLNENTLIASNDYYEFSKKFGKHSSAEFYMEPPVFFDNMKAFVDPVLWQKLKKNKKYITCFKQAGLHFYRENNSIRLIFKTRFSPVQEQIKRQYYNSKDIFTLFSEKQDSDPVLEKDSLPKIIITNLDLKKHEEYFDDGSLKLEVRIKEGRKDGVLKCYYPNGDIKLKGYYKDDNPSGKWKYYDVEGDLIKTDIYE